MVLVTGWVTARDNIKCLPVVLLIYADYEPNAEKSAFLKYNLNDYASSNPLDHLHGSETHHSLMYSVPIRGPELRAISIWLALGRLLRIWLSVGVRPPSFNQVPVAQWENSWLVCI